MKPMFQYAAYGLFVFTVWISVFSHLIAVTLSSADVKRPKQNGRENATPTFDPSTPTNVTVQTGSTAYMPCKIKDLDSKRTVSFIRQMDAHIVTVDDDTYIWDKRFSSHFNKDTDTWNLQLKYAQPSDVGIYECQISTVPKISRFIQLNVIVPRIKMDGDSDVYVKAGSPVSLRCIISRSLEEPDYIFWYQDNERVLNDDRSFISNERISADTTVSKLTIHNTRRRDSGNYSCSPSNLQPANTILHVLNGEQPAAMQHGNAGWARGEGDLLRLSMAIIVVMCRNL